MLKIYTAFVLISSMRLIPRILTIFMWAISVGTAVLLLDYSTDHIIPFYIASMFLARILVMDMVWDNKLRVTFAWLVTISAVLLLIGTHVYTYLINPNFWYVTSLATMIGIVHLVVGLLHVGKDVFINRFSDV